MDLFSPAEVRLDDNTEALIRDVDEVARLVHEYRPLPSAVVRRIEDDLLGERVYSSNAIEGNTLDLRETVMILKSGVLGARKRREALEARNLGEAARTIMTWRDAGEECHSTHRLLQVHRIVLHEIEDSVAGRFRGPGVVLFGAKHQPPDESAVPDLVETVMETLTRQTDAHTVRRATWGHWALARIHPFQDGNGRVARLWQDLLLYEGGLTCAVIRPEDRRDYLSALGDADEGEFNPFAQMIARAVSRTFDRYLTEIQAAADDEEFVKDLVGETDIRLTQRRQLSYMRWSRMMERLRSEFELFAASISKKSRELQVQVRPYEIIDQSRWENIQAGVGAEQTWFFIVDFQPADRRRRRRYFFFFGKHYWREGMDDAKDRSEQRVSVLISEDDGTGKGIRLDEIADCPISIREVYVVEDEYVVRSRNPTTGQEEYVRDASPSRVARDFLREVICQRLT